MRLKRSTLYARALYASTIVLPGLPEMLVPPRRPRIDLWWRPLEDASNDSGRHHERHIGRWSGRGAGAHRAEAWTDDAHAAGARGISVSRRSAARRFGLDECGVNLGCGTCATQLATRVGVCRSSACNHAEASREA